MYYLVLLWSSTKTAGGGTPPLRWKWQIICRGRRPRRPENKRLLRIKNQPVILSEVEIPLSE